MSSFRASLAGLAVGLIFAAPASALSTLDFSDGACDGLTVCAKTLAGGAYDGVGVTFANPTVESGTPDFFNLSNGIALGSGSLGQSWTVVFDDEVAWVAGILGFADNNQGLSVTGPGVAATALLSGVAAGAYDLGAGLTFLAGETYTFVTSNSNSTAIGAGGVALQTMIFDAPGAAVPLPAPVLMLGAGLAGLVALGRRRRVA